MNENIDLTKILENCPEGTAFWSDNYGEVKFLYIYTSLECPIIVRRTDGYKASYTKEGWCSIDFPASCLLWPSKDCRDWSKFTAPWYKKDKKEKFDPNTLQPFDKVLVKSGDFPWRCDIFSYYRENKRITCYCISDDYIYNKCIPYNEDTKHLVGKTDEAPEYYRYWED